MIVAYCRNKGIGVGQRLPFKLEHDMRRFKRITTGNKNNAIIMGKNTWLSISKRPLPNRDNLVLSRTLKGDNIFNSMRNIKRHCHQKRYDDIWIIGGEDVYKQFIWDANLETICVTEVGEDGDDCDTFFPKIPPWFELLWRGSVYIDNDTSFRYAIYERPDIYAKRQIPWPSSRSSSSMIPVDYR